jgi:hypothetical protein
MVKLVDKLLNGSFMVLFFFSPIGALTVGSWLSISSISIVISFPVLLLCAALTAIGIFVCFDGIEPWNGLLQDLGWSNKIFYVMMALNVLTIGAHITFLHYSGEVTVMQALSFVLLPIAVSQPAMVFLFAFYCQ